MNHIFKAGVIMLACFGFTAGAQDWYHDREQRFHGEEWRGHLFEHVRVDLEHLPSEMFAAPREKQRLENTKRELSDLQGKLERNFYDDRELKDVLDSMVKTSNDQRLSPQDRTVVADDLNRLRDYRAHHNNWMRH
jgi:uncharacterized protein YfkK (UPF0435 family)